VYRKIYVASIEMTVVVVEVLGYCTGAVWCATHVLSFDVHNLGCSMFFTVDEHRIVIRSYGTPVVCKCSSVLSENIIDQGRLSCVLRCIRYCKYGMLLMLV